ncbi:MAG: vitamin K epoxide reductase family protein [Candidatus Harrisonbacteria bacterium]|nr:vitamin K epoxide reductase family protein [Candidatus Harrisonbacteria bacterium]
MNVLFYLCIIALAWSGFFIVLYIRNKKSRKEAMVCYIGQDCDKVVHSKYSIFLGIPLELLGGVYYFLIAFGYSSLLFFPRLAATPYAFLLFAFSLAAFLFSIYLVSIQAFTLKEWCTWCLFSAGISTFIFLFSVISISSALGIYLLMIKTALVIFHLIGVAVGLGAATLTDIFFFRFLKDFRISQSEADVLHTLSQVIWFALGIIVISGIGLFLPQMSVLIISSKFLIKMIIVGFIITNGVLLNLYISPRMLDITFGKKHHHMAGELHNFRKIAFASGAISLVSWYGALIVGVLDSIPLTVGQAFLIYLAILALAVSASQGLEYLIGKKAAQHSLYD